MLSNPSREESNSTDVSSQIGFSENVDTTIVKPRKYEILYIILLFFSYIHIAAMYGIYLCFTSAAKETIILNIVLVLVSLQGITAGVHRLWSHKSYKAKMPLQILLMLFSCVAGQRSIECWVKLHRLHHKYSDTDADPHNANRGFFFSHIGWVFVRKHEDVIEKGKIIDMSDIKSNPVVMFQSKYAYLLLLLMCYIIPTFIPMYFWKESFVNAWHVTLLRFCYCLNGTFLINSAGHTWGYKPYDKNIAPAQNVIVAAATLGEGSHNYHHVFPYDYRGAEWGNNILNLPTLFIEFFEKVGWAYDLKSIQREVVSKRAKRTGDGSYMEYSDKVST